MNIPFYKLTLYSIRRRKGQSLFSIFGISLGVILFSGILISILSTRLYLADALVSDVSPYHVNFGLGYKSSFNYSTAERISEELVHFPEIKAYDFRFVLPLALSSENGALEYDRRLIAINSSSTNIGKYGYENGSDVNLSELKRNEVVIGNGLADLLSVGVGDTLSFFCQYDNLIFTDETSGTLKIVGVLDYNTSLEREVKGDFLLTHSKNIPLLLSGPDTNYTPLGNQTYEPPAFYSEVSIQYSLSIGTDLNELDKSIFQLFKRMALAFTYEAVKSDSLGVSYVVNEFNSIENWVDFAPIITISNPDWYVGLSEANFFISQIRIIQYISGGLIVLITLFVMLSVQSLFIYEQNKFVALLSTLGARRSQIVSFFLVESVILGSIASIIGLGIGTLYASFLIFVFSIIFEYDGVSLSFDFSTYLISLFSGLFFAIISTIYPAYTTTKNNPAQVIKNALTDEDERANEYRDERTVTFNIVGILLTAVGLFLFFRLRENPLFNGINALDSVNAIQALYLPVLLIIFGINVFLFQFFKLRKYILWSTAISLFSWAILIIFLTPFLINEESNQGGLTAVYFSFLVLCTLIIASILIFYNSIGIITVITRGLRRRTPLLNRVLSYSSFMAFRSMKYKKLKSTLIFALFFTSFTFNIVVNTVTHNLSGEFNPAALEESADSDIILFEQSTIPSPSSSTALERINTNKTLSDQIVSVGHFTLGLFDEVNTSQTSIEPQPAFVLGSNLDDLYHNKTMTLDLVLDKDKAELFESDIKNLDEEEEDELLWEAVLSGQQYSIEKPYPVVLSNPIAISEHTIDDQDTHNLGDVIYLNATNGTNLPFVIGGRLPQSSVLLKIIHEWQRFRYPKMDIQNLYITSFKNVDEIQITGLIPDIDFQNISVRTDPISDIYLLKTTELSENNAELARDLESFLNGPQSNISDNQLSYTTAFLVSDFAPLALQSLTFLEYIQFTSSLALAVSLIGLVVLAIYSILEQKSNIIVLSSLGISSRQIFSALSFELIYLCICSFFGAIIAGILGAYSIVSVSDAVNSSLEISFSVNIIWILGYAFFSILSSSLFMILPGIIAVRISPLTNIK